MKRMSWVIGSTLALLLVGGLALDVSAQQPAAPAPPAQTESKPAAPAAPADKAATPPAQQQQPSGQVQTPQVPSSNVQIERRTERVERVVEQPGGSFLGMDPTVALAIGAVLFIVIVVGLVAMSRRTEEVHHTHHV